MKIIYEFILYFYILHLKRRLKRRWLVALDKGWEGVGEATLVTIISIISIMVDDPNDDLNGDLNDVLNDDLNDVLDDVLDDD